MNAPDPARLGDIAPGRVPPSDLEAESYVLSWAMMNDGDLDRATAVGFGAEHFYADANRRIWESIVRLSLEEGKHVDVVSVAGDLRDRNRLDQVGGTPYLVMLIDTLPVEAKPGILEQHCRRIMDCWVARQVQSSAHIMIARLYQPQGEPRQAIIERAEQEIWEIAHQNRDSGYEPAGLISERALGELARALRDGKNLLGTTTGFSDLDKQTTGIHPGDLIIIAARPGIGKTAMACSMLLRIAAPPTDERELPEAVYLHSLEMPKEQMALRMVCSLAAIEFQKLRLNQLGRTDWEKLFAAADRLSRMPILVDDKPAVSMAEVRSNIRKIKRDIELGRVRARKLSVVCVDYLQLMSGEKGAGREREISSISQDLKNTAKGEAVGMLALSQLNREVEKGPKGSKRPVLSNLRESGSIEQDADAVWFLYREKYYDREANDEAEVIIAKQRNGPTCTVLLTFDGPTTTFHPIARGYEEFHDVGDPAPHYTDTDYDYDVDPGEDPQA